MTNNTELPDGLVLREFFSPSDYPHVIALWKNAGPGIHLRISDEEVEINKKLQRDPDLFLVAEVSGQIIGTVLGGFDGRRGMVYHLAVADAYRRQGIGKSLMKELEKRMKLKGCIRSYLLVTRENAEAIHFYQMQGWDQMDILTFGKDLV